MKQNNSKKSQKNTHNKKKGEPSKKTKHSVEQTVVNVKPKSKRKTILKIVGFSLLGVFVCVLGVVLYVLQSPSLGVDHSSNTINYNHVVKDSLGGRDPRLYDIALLGAHDAFTSKLTTDSPVDPAEGEDSLAKNNFLRALAKGISLRVTKTQVSGTEELFRKGIRYFDVRLSYVDGIWYTKHAYLSAPLEEYLIPLLKCLSENPGEFIIFDMQHVYLGGQTYAQLFEYLENVFYNGKSIFDFVRGTVNEMPLSTTTYKQLTSNGTNAAAIIITKVGSEVSKHRHYNSSSAIRSRWHNVNDENELIAAINNEINELNAFDPDAQSFKVNQAILTGRLDKEHLVRTITGWSLLKMAQDFNYKILQQENLKEWFDALPILMVDYADTNYKNFNDDIMSFIYEYN